MKKLQVCNPLLCLLSLKFDSLFYTRRQDEVEEIVSLHGLDDDTVATLRWRGVMHEASLTALTPDMVANFELTDDQRRILNEAIADLKGEVKIRYTVIL